MTTRNETNDTDDDFVTTRRWIIGLSTLGAANMSVGALRQLGLIGDLPDPPIRGFDSNAVLMSPQAFVLGVPDAPVAALGLLANVPFSLAGGPRRQVREPLLPVTIAAKAIVEASVGVWYLVQMRTRLHMWCAYCLAGASINAAIAALALREARAALVTRRARAAGTLAAVAIAGLAFGVMTLVDARRRTSRTRES
jgi:uncharacterized membrane protein